MSMTSTITQAGAALLMAKDLKFQIEDAMKGEQGEKFFAIRVDAEKIWDKIAIRDAIIRENPKVTSLTIRRVKNMKAFHPKYYMNIRGKVSL